MQDSIISSIPTSHFVVGNHPCQDAQVGHVVFRTVQTLHCILLPLHGVAFADGWGIYYIYQFSYEFRALILFVGIQITDVCKSMCQHGATVYRPLSLKFTTNHRGCLIHQRLRIGDNLLAQPVGAFQYILSLCFPVNTIRICRNILITTKHQAFSNRSHCRSSREHIFYGYMGVFFHCASIYNQTSIAWIIRLNIFSKKLMLGFSGSPVNY